jgi:hypothetical protein
MDFIVGLLESCWKTCKKGQENNCGKGSGRTYNAILIVVV